MTTAQLLFVIYATVVVVSFFTVMAKTRNDEEPPMGRLGTSFIWPVAIVLVGAYHVALYITKEGRQSVDD